MPPTPRWVRLGLLALVGTLVLAAMLAAAPGYLTVDEGAYHLMAGALARGRLVIDNGYEDVRSLAMGIYVGEAGPIRPHGGHLVAQYPPFWSALTLPLYLLEGYRGLFHANAIALGVLLLLTFRLGRALWDDARVALLGAAILGLGTCAMDYASAAWPHLAHVAFITGAMLLGLLGARQEGGRGLGRAAAAGLLLGLDVGIRLDGAFAAPVLLMLQLFQPRPRVRQVAASLLGLLPGLGLLACANHAKFGSWSPLSYGISLDGGLILRFLPGVAGLGLLVALRLALLDPRLRAWLAARRAWGLRVGLTAALLTATLLFLWPTARSLVRGFYLLVVDFRAWNTADPPIGWSGDLHAVRFVGGFKKALLQSFPWLPLALVPLVRWVRRREGGIDLPVLALLPAVFVLAYSIRAWHGGLCLNLRYLLPVLPIAALLAARTLVDLLPAMGRAWPWLAGGAMGAAGLLFLPALLHPQLSDEAAIILTTPLRLALLLGGLLLLGAWPRAARVRWLGGATAAAALATIAWGACAGIAYDTRLARAWRVASLAQEQRAAAALPAHALVLVDYHYPLFGLIDTGQVRMASILTKPNADLPALVTWHRDHGWPIYGMLQEKNWRALQASGVLGPVQARAPTDMGGGAQLAELIW